MAGYCPFRQSILQDGWRLKGAWAPNSDVWKSLSLRPGATGTLRVRFSLPHSTVPGVGERFRAAAINYTVVSGGLKSITAVLTEKAVVPGAPPGQCIAPLAAQTTPAGFNLNPGACHHGTVSLLSPSFNNADICVFGDFDIAFTAGASAAAIRVECVEFLYDFNAG